MRHNHPVRKANAVFAGQVLSWLGDSFQMVALPVAIVLAHGSTVQMAASITALTLSRLMFTLFGGVWADRLQPRTVMAAADGVRAASALVLALAFWRGQWSTPLVVLSAALSGGAGCFFNPAFMRWRQVVVPENARRRTYGTLSSLRQLMTLLGPAAAGAVVGFAGPAWGFVVNAVTYAGSLVAVVSWAQRIEQGPIAPEETFSTQLTAGWRAVRSRSWLMMGLLAAGFYHIGNGMILVLAPLLVVKEMGGAHAVAVVAAAEGLGGLVGAALGARVHVERALFFGWAPLVLMPLWGFGFAVLHSVWPIAVLAALGYAGLMFYDVHWEMALQFAIPSALQGRVHSWDISLSFVALPLGSMAAPGLAATYGTRDVIAVAACTLLVAAVAPLFLRSMREFRIPRPTPTPVPAHA